VGGCAAGVERAVADADTTLEDVTTEITQRADGSGRGRTA
jgi:hypothetical protein